MVLKKVADVDTSKFAKKADLARKLDVDKLDTVELKTAPLISGHWFQKLIITLINRV